MIQHFRKLGSESLVYGLAGVVSAALGVITVPVYTRVFVPAEYGIITLITSGLTLMSILVVLGLDNSMHRWYWDTEDSEERKTSLASWFWCQIGLSAAVAAIVVAVAPLLARGLVQDGAAAFYVRTAALILPLMAFPRVTMTWFRLQRQPWRTTSYAVGLAILTVALTLLLVLRFDFGIAGVYVGQLCAYSTAALVSIALLRDWIHPRHFVMHRLGAMLSYALPLVPAAVAMWALNLVDRYFLGFYASVEEIGVYQVGYQLAGIMALGTAAFQQAWSPFAFSLRQEHDAADEVLGQALLVYVWVSCFAGVALSLFAPEILTIFTARAYFGAAEVVGLLIFSYVMAGLLNIAAIGAAFARTTRPVGIGVSIAAVLTIVLDMLLIPRFGIRGAAVATLIAWSLVPLYVFSSAQSLHRLPYRFAPAVALLGAGIALAVVGPSIPAATATGVLLKVAILASFGPAAMILRVFPRDVDRHRA